MTSQLFEEPFPRSQHISLQPFSNPATSNVDVIMQMPQYVIENVGGYAVAITRMVMQQSM